MSERLARFEPLELLLPDRPPALVDDPRRVDVDLGGARLEVFRPQAQAGALRGLGIDARRRAATASETRGGGTERVLPTERAEELAVSADDRAVEPFPRA